MSYLRRKSLGDVLDDLSSISDAQTMLQWGIDINNASDCTAADGETDLVFQALQRQINRNLPTGQTIAEDGILGPGTVGALNQLQSIVGQSTPDCSTAANNALAFALLLRTNADNNGVSATANAPGTKTPAPVSVKPSAPPKTTTPAASSSSSGISQYLPFIGIFAAAFGVVYFLRKHKKGQS